MTRLTHIDRAVLVTALVCATLIALVWMLTGDGPQVVVAKESDLPVAPHIVETPHPARRRVS